MPEPSAGTDVILETERLLLRRLRESDLYALAAIYADPAVTRFLGGPRTREDTRTRLGLDDRGHRRAGIWPVGDDSPRRRNAHRPVRILVQDVEGTPGHEIAYLLGSEWWGSGYATEAAAAIRDHARARLGFDRLISLIDPENAASKAVALRIGMHHERDLVFEGHPTALFAL